jgi:hypothetical protein
MSADLKFEAAPLSVPDKKFIIRKIVSPMTSPWAELITWSTSNIFIVRDFW